MRPIEYEEASGEVRAVYDEIRQVRQTDYINNFWKALANDPASLRRIWDGLQQVMTPGALDPFIKELIYLAVSIANRCPYCTASHTASARNRGMSDGMLSELLAVVGMASQTNALATGYRVEIDAKFREL